MPITSRPTTAHLHPALRTQAGEPTVDFRLDSLTALMAPRSLAVVGASSSPDKIGGIPLDYALRYGFDGPIYPINPKGGQIQGLSAATSLRAVGEPIDMAIMAEPAALVDGAIEDAIAAGVKSVVLFSSGFAEVGDEGRAAQARLQARVQEAGLRLIGPNCLGLINVRRQTYATFSPVIRGGRVNAGRIGLVSQSGAFGAYGYLLARERGVGLSQWVTTGNEADVQLADCLAWLAQDDDTDVIMGYMEGCRDGPRLRAALALAQARGKPVVMVKVGRTELGADAAASHTAALAGDDAIYDAVFRRYGVIRAHNVTEFFDLAHGAAVAGRPRDRSIGLFTLSGGVGALMADDAAMHGMGVPPLSDAAQDQLRNWVPFAAPRNPVDITGQVTNDPTLIERTARLMLQDQDFASWLGFFAAAGTNDVFWPVLHDTVQALRKDFPDTLLAVSTVLAPDRREALEAMRCLVFSDPSDGIRTISALAQSAMDSGADIRGARTAQVQPLQLPRGALSEARALDLLAAAGVPVAAHHVATTADEAAAAAEALGGQVVVKVLSADIAHKSDVGGVALRLVGAAEVRSAFEQVVSSARAAKPGARIDGALVAPMVGEGVECIAGVHRDPVFGPVLMFGLGGIHVEVLRDVSFAVLPVARDEVLRMVRSLRGFAILAGARGRPPVDLDALTDALCALAEFALAAGDTLSSVEINPLIALSRDAGGCVAVDALIVGAGAAA